MPGAEPFFAALREALASGTFVKCSLGKPLPAAPEGLRNIYLRPVLLRGQSMVSWTWRFATRDEVKNLSAAETVEKLRMTAGVLFGNADLFAATGNATLKCNRRGEPAVFFRKAPERSAVDERHNREKQRWINPASPWLEELGISNGRGEVLPSAQAKWRQINKFVEIVSGLVGAGGISGQPKIADMGCGKGYLTFALHAFLKEKGMAPQVTGVECRPALVELCQEMARRHQMDGLNFTAGNIAGFDGGDLDMLIALHACDTATDEAIAHGVRCGARVIVVAPCCHKQVRQCMNPHNEMAPVLRHGILEERQAEILTDGIRALLLEAAGFDTKVFEFISTEHTAKNLMITAVRRGINPPGRTAAALAQVAALKMAFGITRHDLEDRLFPAAGL